MFFGEGESWRMQCNGGLFHVHLHSMVGLIWGDDITIMPSKMEVASQHCDTVTNKTKDILDTVNIERIFKHDSRARHPVQSSVRGTLRVPRRFMFSLGQLRSIERFRTVETVDS